MLRDALAFISRSAMAKRAGNSQKARLKGAKLGRRLRFEPMEERALLSVQPAGDEFIVNSTTFGDQRGWVESLGAVAANSTGNSVITWSSDGQDGSEWGIYARRISATNGLPAGPEIPVNQFTAGAQLTSTVAMDADGDFVIAWASAGQDGDGYGIYARRFDASGEPAGDEFRVNDSAAGEQVFPAVAVNAEGAFVVSWQSKVEGGDWDIFARAFDSEGNPLSGDVPVNSQTTGDQYNASVIVSLDNHVAITWTGPDASESGVFLRFLDFAGTPSTPEIPVNELTQGNQGVSTIASVGPDSIVVTWWAQSQIVTGNFDLFAKVYSSEGIAFSTEIPINATSGINTAAKVAGNGEGVFAVAWTRTGADGAGEGVVARAFTETGAPLSAEKRVNDLVAGDQTLPSVAFVGSDRMLVTWSSQEQDGDGFDVYARRFTVKPATITVEDVVAIHHDAIPLNDFVSQWSLNPTNGKPYLLLAQSNWSDAHASAGSLGGYLVAVGDQTENDWVWQSFSGGGIERLLWIGLNDLENEGVFEWTNGEPVVFTHWEGGSPSPSDDTVLGPEDYVQMGYFTCETCDGWNDLYNVDFWHRPLQGVVEFDSLQPAFTAVPSGAVLQKDVLQLIVGFDVAEGLSDDVASPMSPANPANWQISRNGVDISEWITQIDWVFNAGTSRYEAVLSFDDPLGDGRYDLTVLDGISDNYGNQLDGDGDGNPGGDFVRTFYIGGAAPVAGTGGPYLVTEGESLVLDASATTDIDSLDSIYWTNVSGASLQVANQDGSGLAALVTEVSQPRGMAVDTTHRFAYWTELGEREIRRASLDGPGTDEFVVDIRNGAAGIAFDLAAGKMYWSDSDATDVNNGERSGKIRRANLDGSNPEDVVAADLRHPAGVAVDSVHGKVYWSDLEGHLDGKGAIRRANLDGTGMETFVDGIDEANGIALDLRHGKLYWTESSSGRIQRANLDGSGMEDVITGLIGVTTIALNLEDETLYWTESAGNVKGASVDGTGRFTVAAGIGEPWGVAVVPALRYKWDIDGDGDYGDAAGINPVLSWQQLTDFGIADDGTYAVRLRVTDDLGLTSYAETTLTVQNAAPANLELDPLEAYLEGNEITLIGRFDDPGALDTHRVLIDWADGTSEEISLAVGSRSFSVSHRYLDNNGTSPFSVSVTILDDDGGQVSAGREIFISNEAPEVLHLDVTPDPVDEGHEVLLTGAIADAGRLDTHTATIDWGDGTSSEVVVDQSVLMVVPVERNDPNPPVLLFDLLGDGTVAPLPSIPADASTQLSGPLAAVFSRTGELFVSNRHGNEGDGSISRFRLLADGSFEFNGLIAGNGLAGVHDLAFSPSGELFAANRSNGLISRFTFDDDGQAIANGTIPSRPLLLGLAFSASGELFANNYYGIDRFLFDAIGQAIPNGIFSIPGENSHQFVEFSPSNELFVPTNGGENGRVYRFRLDENSTLVPNGVIEIPGSAAGVAFTPNGEMFVTSAEGPIQRFSFDDDGTAVLNGTLPYTGLGAPAIFDLHTFTATHVYQDDNPTGTASDVYPVSVTVSDDDEGEGIGAIDVTVANVAPAVEISDAPIVINVGQPFTLQALANDSSPFDTVVFTWQVTREEITVASGDGETFTFTPTQLGAYLFTLTGTDDDGGIGTSQLVLEAEACSVPGDTNGDCSVDLEDLNNVRNHFGETGLGVVDLSFNSPAPNTLLDKDGVGTGFTHRLPGTGGGLPVTDPNIDLEPGINGRLLLKSTQTNANGGSNLGELEAPGVLQEGIGQDDFNLTATFLNVHVPNSGDNLTLYAGIAWNNTVRMGFHDSNVYHIAINLSGVDEILYTTTVNAFTTGDDVTLTLSRRAGKWSVSWQNHTNPAANGESPAFDLPWLNDESNLYLGVQHASPTTTVQQTAAIDSFTLDILRPIPGDTNGDFIVDLSDLNAVRNNFGASFPAPSSEASPSTQRRGMNEKRALDRNAADAVFGQLVAVYQEREGSSPVGNRRQTRANLPRFMRP